tara:strand:- start:61 stop:369 length:309 start_codon:yes stop_codon:yes gene_type:complete
MKMKDKKIIGYIGVDSGTIWVGDPCYIIHKDKLPKSLGTDWFDLCGKTDELPKSFNYELGHEGLGVMSWTKYGDGQYPVYMIGDNDGIYIDFVGDYDEDKDK